MSPYQAYCYCKLESEPPWQHGGDSKNSGPVPAILLCVFCCIPTVETRFNGASIRFLCMRDPCNPGSRYLVCSIDYGKCRREMAFRFALAWAVCYIADQT